MDNTITSVALEHAVFLGGYCNGWIDNSDLYIDGNTIVGPACGVALWQSGGSNKVMTCDNAVTAPWGGICVWSSTYDGPYGLDNDGDGIQDCDEPAFCRGTVADVPEVKLGTNRLSSVENGGKAMTRSLYARGRILSHSDSSPRERTRGMKRVLTVFTLLAILATTFVVAEAAPDKLIGINVLLNTGVTDAILADLGTHGQVLDVLYELDALTMKARTSELSAIRALPYVAAANPDAQRKGAPVDTVFVEDLADGLSTWDLDAINVTDFGFNNRQVPYDGTGVYVAVLDTGLVQMWRRYLPQERIATQHAICFGGGGGEKGWVSTQPNKWERDTNSHGTHVASTILGYSLHGTPVNGVAPMARVIPVKVLNQNGFGWSSMVARGITYVAELKEGPLANYPVVINMSLGGPVLDAMEKAAIDYAISKGVIVVASAGNEGTAGMGYPGAYAPVISVAASGWVGEWSASGWWYANVADPTNPADFYITDFSSRQLTGQDLDVAAPGSWVVGPYQVNMGQISYYYLGGTSMSSPHVAGIVALMAQKYPALTAPQAESILEGSAIYLAPGSRDVLNPAGYTETFTWGADATGAGLVNAVAALAATP